MRKYIMLAAVALGTLAPQTARAEHPLKVPAHLGIAYALQTFNYGWSRRVFRMEKGDALIYALTATAIASITWEFVEGQPSGRDLLWDGVGAGASIGTCLVFDF